MTNDSSINTGDGSDTVTIDRIEEDITIDTGAGNDTVTLDDVSSGFDAGSVDLGTGTDTLVINDTLEGTDATFDGGDGIDSLVLNNVSLDDWNDGVSDQFTNFENVTLSDGVEYNLEDGEIVYGDADDTINMANNIDNNLDTNGGNDNINIADDVEGDSTINTGDGNDTVTVGDDFDNGTLNTGTGNDTVTINGDLGDGSTESGVINLNAGDDSLTIDNNISSGSSANGGEGTDSLILNDVSLDDWNDGVSDQFTNFENVTLSDGNTYDLDADAPTLDMSITPIDSNSSSLMSDLVSNIPSNNASPNNRGAGTSGNQGQVRGRFIHDSDDSNTQQYEIKLEAGLTDDSETLSEVTIDNLPTGATIDAGTGITDNGDDTYSIDLTTVSTNADGVPEVTMSSSEPIPQDALNSITSSVTSITDGGDTSTVMVNEPADLDILGTLDDHTFTMDDNDIDLNFDNIDNASYELDTLDLGTGDGNNIDVTNLDISDVLDMTGESNDILTILGDEGDTVTLDTDTWTQGDTIEVDGNTFDTYTGSSGAEGLNDIQIMIDSQVDVVAG